MLRGVGLKVLHAGACLAEGALHAAAGAGDGLAVAGHHPLGLQRLDGLQRALEARKALAAVDLRKDHAHAVLPQRITGDQDARGGLEQQHRQVVVAGGGVNLPGAGAQAHRVAGAQGVLRLKTLATLAGGAEAEGALVPALRRVQGRLGHPGLRRRPARLQRAGAAAVVAVQVGVGDAGQRLPTQSIAHQRHGLRGVLDVARVHQRGLVAQAQDVGGRQPAAVEHADVVGDRAGALGHADRVLELR